MARAANRIRAAVAPIPVTRHTQTAGLTQAGKPIRAGDAPIRGISLIPARGAATLVVSLIRAGSAATLVVSLIRAGSAVTLADKAIGAKAVNATILPGEETTRITGVAVMVAVMATRADTTARGMDMAIATLTPMGPAITLKSTLAFQPVTTINGTAGFPTQAVTQTRTRSQAYWVRAAKRLAGRTTVSVRSGPVEMQPTSIPVARSKKATYSLARRGSSS